MSSNRTLLWGVLLLALAGGFLYRQSVLKEQPAPPRANLLFITGGSGPYWQMAISGAKDAAKKCKADVEILFPEQEEGVADQTKLLLDLDTDAVDGIAISPLNADTQTHLINTLASAVNVVTFDSDAPLSERQCYIGTSNLRGGQLAGELISEALPEGGKIVVLYANMLKSNMIERAEGLQSYLVEHPEAKIEIADTLIDEGELDKCKEELNKVLDENSDIAGIVGMNAYHGPVILEVLKAKELLGKIKVTAFDDAQQTLDGVADGNIFGTVVQDPYMYGYEAVRKLNELHQGAEELVPITGHGVVNVPCSALLKDDVAGFRDKLKARLDEASTKQTPGKDKEAAKKSA